MASSRATLPAWLASWRHRSKAYRMSENAQHVQKGNHRRVRASARDAFSHVEHTESDCEEARTAPLGFELPLFCAAIGGILKRPRAPMAQARHDPTLSVEYEPPRPSKCPHPPFLDQSCAYMAMCSSVTGSHGRASVGSCTRHVQKHSPTVTRRAVAACRPPAPHPTQASSRTALRAHRTSGSELVVNVHTLPVRPNPRARVRSHPSLPI